MSSHVTSTAAALLGEAQWPTRRLRTKALIQLASQDEPPLRFAAGADAAEVVEKKAKDMLAHVVAHTRGSPTTTPPTLHRTSRRSPRRSRPSCNRSAGVTTLESGAGVAALRGQSAHGDPYCSLRTVVSRRQQRFSAMSSQ
jgi:hypothetical protein